MTLSRPTTLLFASIAIALALNAVALPAQEAADPMATMMEMAAPGEQHEMLAKMVGSWTYDQKTWTEPGTPPIESTGTMEADSWLDGRFVRAVWSGDMMGMPFTGIGINGFDNNTGKFTNVWMDNMGTGTMMFTGDCDDDDCSSVTLAAPFTQPGSGQETMMRLTSAWASDDEMHVVGFLVMPDGTEFKNMEIRGQRAE